MVKIKKSEFQTGNGIFEYYICKTKKYSFNISKSVRVKNYTIICNENGKFIKIDGSIFFNTQKEISEAIKLFLEGKRNGNDKNVKPKSKHTNNEPQKD